MQITIKHSGDFKQTEKFLTTATTSKKYLTLLNSYGARGVSILASATPVDTGKTAISWNYRIVKTRAGTKVVWFNTNRTNAGIPIVLLIQYGHGTRDGSYISGRDIINPAIRPLMEQLSADLLKEFE